MAGTNIQWGEALTKTSGLYTSKYADKSGTTTYNYIGTEEQIRAKQIEMDSQGYDTDVEEGWPWKLTAVLSYSALSGPTQPEPTPVWSISPHTGEQEIFSCGDLAVMKGSGGASLTPDTIDRIRQKLSNPDVVLTSPTNVATDLANATSVYYLTRMGAGKRQTISKSVTRTITVSTGYASTWDISYEGRVMSKATLINRTNMPNWVAVNIPNSQDNIALGHGLLGYKGYLDTGVTMDNVSKSQVQIKQTWLCSVWSKLVYENIV